MPTVSLIIPTYNRASLVRRAIESALNQSRVPDEIIVVDDGSTDNTREVLASCGPPVIVIGDGINRGLPAARNRGLDTATGDYIAFLDSDDTLLPASVEQRLKALEAHPDVDVVYTDANLVSSDGDFIARFSAIRRHPRPSGDVFYRLMFGNFSPVHTYLFRRTAAITPIRMDETLRALEDYDFWLKLACISRFLYLDKALANYHVHDGMMTFTDNDAMRHNRIVVQGRGIHSDCFSKLSSAQQAHILTQYGASYAAVIGDMPQARAHLRRALALKPFDPQASIYWLITWSGKWGVDHLNAARRLINRRVLHSAFPTA